MKRILVTGSTAGIGKLLALSLAKEGHHVLIHGRNAEKVQNTVDEIKESATNDSIAGVVSDLSDFEHIKRMISEVETALPKLDVLINNAGVFKSAEQFNNVGLDLRFAVNYFAPYLLTNGLKPLLRLSDAGRVINLSSAAQSPVELSALAGATPLSNNEAYAQSKLALTMWSFGFAKTNPSLTTIAVNPGSLLNTRMANEAYGQYWSPASKGSDILHELALSKEYTNCSGQYFDNDKGNPKGEFAPAHPDAYDEDMISKLLQRTAEIVN